ncbi:MAG: endonuclease [Muribaculaceae bacterium]|nr:endonuclease [Muribaculaceae bacterium]
MRLYGTILATAAICSLAARADIPQGYYTTLDGKSGEELSAAVTALSAGHVRVTYSTKTWPAFETTDVRTVNGRKAWRDMYSNNLVYLPGHDALNIEHSVANSWWGGKSGDVDAYSDLFHLNPSDQNANNKKGNYPPGKVADARLLDNGLMLIGTPVAGQGGGAASVFEPADEYKGDFARAYFYVFTAYPEAPWKEEYAYVYGDDGKLSPWAVALLLDWHRQDPVDTEEMERNEAIYALQKNRNPFIDYPSLAEYIWGDMTSTTFSLTEELPVQATDRPAAPVFAGAWMTGVNTYALRWWDGFTQMLEHDGEGTLMVSIDGRDYYPSQGMLDIDPAESHLETHVYSAYVVREVAGMELRSPVARLTAVARNPETTDYSDGVWEQVTSATGADLEEGLFLLLTSNTLHVMSVSGGTSSSAFMESAGFVEFNDNGQVTQLPVDAAVVRVESAGGGKYRLSVSDVSDNYKGSWNATAKNKMKLDAATYTPATASVNQNGEFIFTFDQYGSLQFNKTQPRFLNYETSQTPVYLYRFTGFNGGSGIDAVQQETPWAVGIDSDGITAPEGTVIYDLGGRRVDGRGLRHGVYIVTGGGRSQKIIF